MDGWCDGGGKIVAFKIMTDEQIDNTAWSSFCFGRPKGIKRITLRCPVCGRRLTTSVEATMDAEIVHRVPYHKPKDHKRKMPRRRAGK